MYLDNLFVATIILLIIGVLMYFFSRKPSNIREWTDDQEVLPSISTYGDLITIHKVRNATYRSITDYDLHYYDKTFKLTDLIRLWLAIEPFGPKLPFGLRAAHVFVSFELADGSFFSVSVEIRKRIGHHFSTIGAIKGALRQFELMYVVADERDVIQLRTNHRRDDVYLYPLQLEPGAIRDIFGAFKNQVNELLDRPSFFNTVVENCTTVLVRNLRKHGVPLPLMNIAYVAPSSIDKLLYQKKLIDTGLSFKEARERFFITNKAQKADGAEDFSQKIRS